MRQFTVTSTRLRLLMVRLGTGLESQTSLIDPKQTTGITLLKLTIMRFVLLTRFLSNVTGVMAIIWKTVCTPITGRGGAEAARRTHLSSG